MNGIARNDDSLVEVVRILVFVQVIVAAVTALEGLVVGAFMGAPGPGLVTGVAAVLTAVLYTRLRRRSPRARRWLVRFQVGWMFFATIDLLLAVFLARRGLELVPILTRFVLPYAIFRILRKPHVRAEFAPASPPANEEMTHAMA